MDGLPQEILENIFSYLPQNELLQSINKVCVTWKQLVSNSPTLWRKIKFTNGKDFPLLMRHFSVVQNLIKYLDLSEYQFNQIIEVDSNIIFPRLTTLCIIYVSSCGLSDLIIKRCPNLEHIELKIFSPSTMRFAIGILLQELAVFNFKTFKIECYCSLSDGDIFDESIHRFIEKETSLQEISIGTRQILNESTLIDIFRLCTNLKHFELENDCISDAVFTSSNQKLKLLSIRMIESDRLTDKGLKALVERAKDLKVINLMTLPSITGKGLLYISQNCHDLEDLTVGGTEEDKVSSGLVHIAAGCPRLKFLNCMNPFISTDTQVISVAQSCRNLQSITIDGAFFLTDRSLFSLAENCLLLKKVSFSCTEFFTIYGIMSLILSCCNLEILRFSQCQGISEMDLEETEKKITEVQEIKERYLERIQSKDGNRSAIEILDLESCTKVSNNTILQLVPLCPELKHLYTYCTLVKKDGVFEQQVYNMCKRLSKLGQGFDDIMNLLG